MKSFENQTLGDKQAPSIIKKLSVYLFTLFFALSAFSQQFTVNELGDTVNKFNSSGQKEACWEENVSGNLFMKGNYINGQKDGMWVTYFPNETLHKIENYGNDKLNGLSLIFDNRSMVSEENTYKNNILHGTVKKYINGRILEDLKYKNGFQHGLQKKYYEGGQIQEESEYNNGLRHGFAKWYSINRHIVAEFQYEQGKLEGNQNYYYPNGNISKLETLKNNILNGNYEEYYETGTTKLSGKYINGLKEGTWTELDENGKIIKETKYSKDKAK